MCDESELSEKEKSMMKCPPCEAFIPSKMNDCEAGKLCEPEDYFELIEKCKLCGKLL